MGPKRLAAVLTGVLTAAMLTGTAAGTAVASPVTSPVTRPFAPGELAGGGLLVSVTANSARSAWAVGMTSFFGPGSRLLAVRWNGTAWRPVPVPRFKRASSLLAVAAMSARDVWAVGQRGADSGGDYTGQTLILHWNGRSWKQAPSPDPKAGGVLYGIAAVSATDAWAVGATRSYQSLILHWNGHSWRRVRSPGGGLLGVAATSARNAWAVGQTYGGSSLILHWNGTAWKSAAEPAGAPFSRASPPPPRAAPGWSADTSARARPPATR